MIKLSRILKDYGDSGALNTLVGIHAAVDERTFLTRGGALLTVLRMRGPDAECLDESQIQEVAHRFEAAVRTLDEDFRLYLYRLKRKRRSISSGTYANAVVQQAVAGRHAYLERRRDELFEVETYWAIVYEGCRLNAGRRFSVLHRPFETLSELLSDQRRVGAMEGRLDQARAILANKVDSLTVQLRDILTLEVLGTSEAFDLLVRLLNYTPYKIDATRLHGEAFIDFQACQSALECYRDHLRLDDYAVQVLTLKEPPSATFAHMLRRLDEVPVESILVTEWKRESAPRIRREIVSRRRHFHNSKASALNYMDSSKEGPKDVLIDDGAVAHVQDLGACLEEIEARGNYFGQFSMTLVVYDIDRDRLRKAVSEYVKSFATFDAQLHEERYNLLNAWLAVLPGNHAFNLRRLWLLNTNYADLVPLFAPDEGAAVDEHLHQEYLAVFETNQGTPYYFSGHVQDVAHAAVLGGTGSGKSFLLNFLITHAQKYQPFTCIFDLGGSYRTLTELFGGTYLSVGTNDRALKINPFVLPPTPEHRAFLCSFVRVLAEHGGYQMSSADERDLREQVDSVYALEPAQRRLLTLANIANRSLRAQLHKWVQHSTGQNGPYSALFDNAEDTLTFSRFQTFDFEGMNEHPEVLQALLFYIFHRAGETLADPSLLTTFKLLVVDEAWRFLHHPAIKAYVREALKTWRRKNAAVILATQSAADWLASDMLPVIVESCPTLMFLANAGMDRRACELLHLNQTESDLIGELVPKKQILIKRPGRSKVVTLQVDPKDYWIYTSDPFDSDRRRRTFNQHGLQAGLDILARSTS